MLDTINHALDGGAGNFEGGLSCALADAREKTPSPGVAVLGEETAGEFLPSATDLALALMR